LSVVLPLRGEASRFAGTPPSALGVGLGYIISLPAEIYSSHLLDFVELTPETLCSEQLTPSGRALMLTPERYDQARATCAELPMVVHGVELSIGSAHGWNAPYLDMLDNLQKRWPFRWHSEHLSFQTYQDASGIDTPTGTPLPLPMTQEAVDLVALRSTTLLQRYGVPFLLENPAHYLTGLPCEPAIADEFVLMNRITAASGCGQLLDLHNLYCNAVNRGFDPFEAVEHFALERVVEIHVAGGHWDNGYWTDAHDSAAPELVWDLLEYTLPRCPKVCGVVFELLEPYAIQLGVREIARNLERARHIWLHQRAPQERAYAAS
jgi:uncharacterized protein (UPF0276 family)